jgi:hypothetical protein
VSSWFKSLFVAACAAIAALFCSAAANFSLKLRRVQQFFNAPQQQQIGAVTNAKRIVFLRTFVLSRFSPSLFSFTPAL